MNYAHLIHTYLEGTLEGHLEEVLFAELGRNPLLRRELTAQIQLVSAARRDAASLAPSEFEKNAIFSELGFSTSGVQAEAVALASAPAAVRVMPSLASVAAMMLGAVLLTVGLRSDDVFFPSGDFLTAQQFTQPAPHATAALTLSATSAAQRDTFSPSDGFLTAQRVSQPRAMAALAFSTTSADDVQKHLVSLPDEIALADNAYLSLPEAADISLSNTSDNAQAIANNTPTVFQEQLIKPSARTISNDNIPKANLQKTTTSTPKPQALTPSASLTEALPVQLGVRSMLGEGRLSFHGMVQYALTTQSAIGFEGGRESATLMRKSAQSSIETASGSAESVFSGTAFYRHTFTGLALSKAIVPFVQAGFGVVGKCGAVQGMGGLRFDVLPEMSFTLAAEYKMPVLYAEQYFQSKAAFSVGFQYHISGE